MKQIAGQDRPVRHRRTEAGAPPGTTLGHRRPATAGSQSVLAKQDGIALLMALFVTATLAALAVSFNVSTQRHLHLVRYYKNNVQAYWSAQSGIQAAAAVLTLSQANKLGDADGYTSPWNHESTYYKETVQAFSALPLCGSSFPLPGLLPGLEDPVMAPQNRSPNDQQSGRSPCFFIDENSKLSLSRLVRNVNQAGEATDQPVFESLAHLIRFVIRDTDLLQAQAVQADTSFGGSGQGQPINDNQARALVSYLVDWMDSPNNTSTLNPETAEDVCPEDGLPYAAKNGALDSTEEIALVCGFRSLQRNVIEEICRHVTAYNLATNINTATKPVLCALLGESVESSNAGPCAQVYERLHPQDPNEPGEDHLISTTDGFTQVLSGFGIDDPVISSLKLVAGVKSDTFRVAVSGVVLDPESGTLEAESRITVVMRQQGGLGQVDLRYYRED